MGTDNHVFPTREELMQSVTLDYAPFYTVLPARAHEAIIENMKFTTIRGDEEIVANVINAQDTERKHVKAGESSKYYAKAFKGLQYAESVRNARSAFPAIHNKIIKALHKQFDLEVWTGADNNGIVVSSDPNHISNNSAALPLTISGNNGLDKLLELGESLKRQVQTTSSSSNMIFAVYGNALKNYMLKTLSDGSTYGKIFRDNMTGVQTVEVPANLASTASSGIVVICPGIVEFNHTLLPQLEKTGTDDRNDEVWANYIYGTAMVDVKEYGGMIVQPITVSD